MIDGRRVLLTCGEIHYPRSTRAMWPKLLRQSKELGLNTITSYVFWNVHETSRGVYDFSGERDVGHFLDLCQEHGLAVFLRAGPYIFAEWNFGGFPPYLRDELGITIRTMNPAYTARVQAFLSVWPRSSSRGFHRTEGRCCLSRSRTSTPTFRNGTEIRGRIICAGSSHSRTGLASPAFLHYV